MPLIHRSNTTLNEAEVIAHVLRDPNDRESVLNIKGIDATGDVFENVQRRKKGGSTTGDVDILVLPPSGEDEATAIQVKRLPMRLDEDGNPDARANKLEGLFDKGVEQAHRDAEDGFHQVYLWLFVLVDGRAANQGRYSHEGLSPAARVRIDQAVCTAKLGPRVGLIQFEWVQSMDLPPFPSSAGGGHLMTPLPLCVAQPPGLTNWLRARRPHLTPIHAHRLLRLDPDR
jgi:hypothetical protein